MTLEQMLYPCVNCQVRAIYCEGDTVSCRSCDSSWPFAEWFEFTFREADDTQPGDQLTLM